MWTKEACTRSLTREAVSRLLSPMPPTTSAGHSEAPDQGSSIHCITQQAAYDQHTNILPTPATTNTGVLSFLLLNQATSVLRESYFGLL
jgi:hypothetical protein